MNPMNGETLTREECRWCRGSGGVDGGAYAPRRARCGDCNGTGYVYYDVTGNAYAPGTDVARAEDAPLYWGVDLITWENEKEGTAPDGMAVERTTLE